MTAVVIGLAVAGGILVVAAAVLGVVAAVSRVRLRFATLRAERERAAIDANQDWIYGLSGSGGAPAPAASPPPVPAETTVSQTSEGDSSPSVELDASAGGPEWDAEAIRAEEEQASELLIAALAAKAELEQRLERERRLRLESHRRLAELLSGALEDLSRVGATANGDHRNGGVPREPLDRAHSLP
jgi:hypothetical protein